MRFAVDIYKIYKILFFLVLILTISIFRIRAYGSTELDFQILLKVGSWISFGFFGLLFLSKYGWLKMQLSEALSFMLFVLFLLSFSYSPLPSRTFILSIMFLCIWIGLRVFIITFSREEVLGLFQKALLIFILASIAVYYLVPELGRQGIWVGGSYHYSSRMTGLAGGANGMGEVASYFSLLCYWNIITRKDRSGLLLKLTLFALGLVILLASWNKMGIGSFFIGLFILNYSVSSNKQNTFKIIALSIIGFAIVIFLLWVLGIQDVSRLLSRSGDAQEVLSFTGRSHIWPVVLHSILERPLLGSGFGILSIANEGEVVGFVAAHAHNVVLQALSSVGTVGLIVFLLSTLLSIRLSVSNKDYLMLTFLIVGLLRGLTESGLFVGTPNMSLIVWLLATFLIVKSSYNITVSQ